MCRPAAKNIARTYVCSTSKTIREILSSGSWLKGLIKVIIWRRNHRSVQGNCIEEVKYKLVGSRSVDLEIEADGSGRIAGATEGAASAKMDESL